MPKWALLRSGARLGPSLWLQRSKLLLLWISRRNSCCLSATETRALYPYPTALPGQINGVPHGPSHKASLFLEKRVLDFTRISTQNLSAMFYFFSLTRQDKKKKNLQCAHPKRAIKQMHNYIFEEEMVNIKIILTVKLPHSLLKPVFIRRKLYFSVMFCKMVIPWWPYDYCKGCITGWFRICRAFEIHWVCSFQ